MPTYEYKCDNCMAVSDIKKSMHSPHPVFCTNCGADGLRRVFNSLAFSIPGDRNRKVAKPKAPDGIEIKPRSS